MQLRLASSAERVACLVWDTDGSSSASERQLSDGSVFSDAVSRDWLFSASAYGRRAAYNQGYQLLREDGPWSSSCTAAAPLAVISGGRRSDH